MRHKKETISGLSVTVYNDNFERAFRQFRKKVQKSGRVQEVRERQHYVKPTTTRRMKKMAAQRRNQKELAANNRNRSY